MTSSNTVTIRSQRAAGSYPHGGKSEVCGLGERIDMLGIARAPIVRSVNHAFSFGLEEAHFNL